MEQKRKINIDVYIGIALALVSAFFLWETGRMRPGAAQFPRMVLMTFLALSVLIAALGVRKTLNPALAKKSDFELSFNVAKMPILAFAIIAIYLVLINTVGFFIATTIFTPLFMLFYGARKIVPMVATTVGLNLFVWVLFVRILNVFIP